MPTSIEDCQSPNSADSAYSSSGVNIELGDEISTRAQKLAQSTYRHGFVGEKDSYGAALEIHQLGYENPVIVSTTDGVGTKVILASQISKFDTIGIDLVAMCVNDILTMGGEPIKFLDYYACGKLDKKTSLAILSGICRGCQIAGTTLAGGETAEMPSVYNKHHFDLAGFSIGLVEREQQLPKKNLIEKGDLIIGLAGDGIHSNGFSLVRKILTDNDWHSNSTLPFQDLQLRPPPPRISIYRDKNNKLLLENLLKPTPIYVKPILNLLKLHNTKNNCETNVKAMVHITGGGVQNYQRILPKDKTLEINLANYPKFEVFSWLAQQGQIKQGEMLKVFNCGIGMGLIVNQNKAEQITDDLKKLGEVPFIIGKIINRNNNVEPAVSLVNSLF